ncbi:MAG TPA: uL15 family ribosomal protein [Patescibacteria group bacterium]|nr:uL15 family ribosomal protein [Patescibacteria group bacterium]
MSISLNNIKKPVKQKLRKRIGRGNSSGSGTYSGRGQKGQNARAGVSNLKRLGMKARLMQIPKVRGFKSQRPKNQVVSVEIINNNFKDNDIVNPQILEEKNLIKTAKEPVKILGKETLKLKGLKFEKIKMSATLKEQLENK